ncbi:MAG: hypothetical protein RLZZ543_1355, partial [Bacteroidota bacterium]
MISFSTHMKAHQLLFALLISFLTIPSFAQSDEALYHEGQLFVKLKEGFERAHSETPSREMQAFFATYASAFQITEVKAGFWFSKTSTNRIVRVFFEDQAETDVFIQQLEASGKVEYAERIPVSKQFLTPNDLGPNSTNTGGQWYLYKTRAQQAWDIQTGSSSIQVAIVDDAVQTTHPELQGVISQTKDMVDGDNDVSPPAATWDHGTFIAGLIGAKTNNGLGIASMGYGVSLFPIKITNNTYPDILIYEYEGVAFAAENGANVINMSWGSPIISQTGLQVITDAYNNGVVLVAAAGNDGTSVVNFPAGFPGVISVASTTNIDAKSSFSNYGSWIDICAPGSQMYSLVPFDGYAIKNGTSFSAPLVSAAAALLLSYQPSLTPDQVASCLTASADNIDIFNTNYVNQLGAGRLNLEQALLCLNANQAQYNATLNSVASPSISSCETSFTPVIRVINNGIDTLFNLILTVQLDNGFEYTIPWEGQINPGLAEFISLHDYQTNPGAHLLTIRIENSINGSFHDGYLPDNTIEFPFQIQFDGGFQLPFSETFESGFDGAIWTVDHQGDNVGWEIATTGGLSSGNKSARLPFYSNYAIGTRDYLLSPTFNLSGYSAVNLTFAYAYQQKNALTTDSLIVSVSNDCGQNWIRMWARGENVDTVFATSYITGASFTPAIANDWCNGITGVSCGSINLNAFAGSSNFMLRFEGYNNNGNNLYIDNINITGVVIPSAAPIAMFSADGNQSTCVNVPVVFSNESSNSPTTYNWTFEGATPAISTAFNPIVSYATPGVYDVQLIAVKGLLKDTLLLSNYITVDSLPVLSITSSLDTVCQGGSVQLVASGALEYMWNAGNGLVPTNNPTVSVTAPYTITYSVNGINNAQCMNSASIQIVTISPPAAP